MKKLHSLGLSLLGSLILGGLLSGCGQPTRPIPAASPTQTATSTAGGHEQVMPTSTTDVLGGYPSSPEQTALRKTFVKYFANPNYASDGKSLFINVQDAGSGYVINYQVAKNIDLASFAYLGSGDADYFKDKHGVYMNTNRSYDLDQSIKTILNVDKDTISIISLYCLKDANHVYCGDVSNDKASKVNLPIVKDADPATFVFVGEQGSYFKDRHNVFCNQGAKGMGLTMLAGADMETFSLVPSSTETFAQDKDTVYHLCDKLIGSDPATFRILETGDYQKDKNHVYYQGWTMPDVDPTTFHVFNLFLTKDKSGVYQNGLKVNKIADPATFLADSFTHGHDKLHQYEIVRWDDERGLEVTIKPLE